MPWKERNAVEERKSFIADWNKDEVSFTELCDRYQITRPTGYLWVARYQQEGEAGLEARSRAPHHCPQAVSPALNEQIVALRRAHPRWGPRKLRAYLHQREPELDWPAASTIGVILDREGLVHPRRRRVRTPPYEQPLAHAQAPNQVWCADYKGWFLCGDRSRCDPLTVSDACSRFLLRCRAVEKADGERARAVFEAVFREYGLPEAIRTDNGPPFASKAPGGLSRLSMWWLRLGIRHERIQPGCPQQNGRHERMHLTLKQETAMPPAANLRRQQEAFLRFQREYNQERPHEALDYRTPASVYVASARVYPPRSLELSYPEGVLFRRISQQGSLKWKGERTFVSEVLGREAVGLLEIDDDHFEVYYGPVLLGWFHGHKHQFLADRGPSRRARQKRSTNSPTRRSGK